MCRLIAPARRHWPRSRTATATGSSVPASQFRMLASRYERVSSSTGGVAAHGSHRASRSRLATIRSL